MNKDEAIAALLLVNQVFKDDAGFLRDTRSREARLAVGLLVSAEAHRGQAPLSPASGGNFWNTSPVPLVRKDTGRGDSAPAYRRLE